MRLGEKELGGPEDSEELITVDAVGCFEDDDEDEEEEEGGGEEEDSEVVLTDNEDPIAKQVCSANGNQRLWGRWFVSSWLPQSSLVELEALGRPV